MRGSFSSPAVFHASHYYPTRCRYFVHCNIPCTVVFRTLQHSVHFISTYAAVFHTTCCPAHFIIPGTPLFYTLQYLVGFSILGFSMLYISVFGLDFLQFNILYPLMPVYIIPYSVVFHSVYYSIHCSNPDTSLFHII